jgi:hypothetical protein
LTNRFPLYIINLIEKVHLINMKKFNESKPLTRRKTADFTKQEISKKVFVVNYKSHRKLCNAVMRFIGQVDHALHPVSHKGYRKIYKEIMNKKQFSFYNDWEGFLIPSRALKEFYRGDWNPLSKQEKLFLNSFKNIKGNFAVIALSPMSSPTTLKHEMAHALFEVNDKYQNEVLKVLNETDLKDVYRILRKAGYAEETLLDESHSCLMNNLSWLKNQGLRKVPTYYEASAKLNFIFDKYAI